MNKFKITYITLLTIALCSFGTVFSQQIISTTNAIELALEHNYGVKIAANAVAVAKNNANILNSGFLPSLTGLAGGSIDRQNTEGQLANGEIRVADGAETRRYNASINLNYTLFDGLGRRYNYKRLKEDYKLSELQARETIENTIVQLLTVYYNVAQQTENLKSLEEVLQVSNQRLERSNYQFQYGQNTKLDVLNAQVDINNDTINIVNAKQLLINAKRDLNLVTGNTISPNFEVDTTVSFLMELNKTDLLQKLKANNITLLQNATNTAINTFLVKSNRSGYLPTIGLTGSYGWNESNNNSPLAFVLQNTNVGLNGGINLTWNLFDGGSTLTRVKNAKLNLETQKLRNTQLELDVMRNFNNAWDDYQNKLTIYNTQQNNIITAQNNFNRTNEKFKLGQVTSIEFRQAQLNVLTAQLSINQAKYDAKLAEILVLQLCGELLNVEL